RAGSVEQAEDVHERRLAAAGGPHDRHEGPRGDREVDAAQRVDLDVAEVVRLREAGDLDEVDGRPWSGRHWRCRRWNCGAKGLLEAEGEAVTPVGLEAGTCSPTMTLAPSSSPACTS